jgi:hypothetical protein
MEDCRLCRKKFCRSNQKFGPQGCHEVAHAQSPHKGQRQAAEGGWLLEPTVRPKPAGRIEQKESQACCRKRSALCWQQQEEAVKSPSFKKRNFPPQHREREREGEREGTL